MILWSLGLAMKLGLQAVQGLRSWAARDPYFAPWAAQGPSQGSRFRYFFGFSDFLEFLDFWAKNGPKRAREGFQWVRGGIPLHLDKLSAQMGPFGGHSGPFLFFNFPKTHFGPK